MPRSLHSIITAAAVLLVLVGLTTTVAADQKANVFKERYIFFNIGGGFRKPDPDPAVDTAERMLTVMREGAALGYNGILVSGWWDQVDDTIKTRFEKIKVEADRLGMALLPLDMSQNYPGADPRLTQIDLREAFPVKDTKLQVQNDVATVIEDPSVDFNDPGFENIYVEWLSPTLTGAWGTRSFVETDNTISHTGEHSVKVYNPDDGNTRLYQNVVVAPFRTYEISVWVKTEEFTTPGNIALRVRGNDMNQDLYIYKLDQIKLVAQTQDWTEYKIRFNSLNNTSIRLNVQAGQTRGVTGTAWIDDINIQETGIYELVRRDSLPVTVIGDNGTVYEEMVDFVIGEEKLILPEGSSITEGMTLRMNWFVFPDVGGSKSAASACHEEFFSFIEKRALDMYRLFPGNQFLIWYDEWWKGRWDPACVEQFPTTGQYLANVFSRSEQMIKQLDNNAALYVLDSSSRSTPGAWMQNGETKRMWNGVDGLDTVVEGISTSTKYVAHGNARREDLEYFANRGHKVLILGYYEKIQNVADWLTTVDQLEQDGITGIEGFIYGTFANNYQDLAAVAQMIKDAGRWDDTDTTP